MKNRFIKLLLAAVLLGSLSPAAAQTREMDLSGEWRFQTDVMDFRRGSLSPRYNHQLQETIMLPGITDDYKIGYKSPYRHVDRLTRVYEYMGPAWYQRDIEFPADWKGKCIFLYFERTHWLSSVWVDTKEVSRLDYISVPHNHDLTDFVTPGKTHRITVCIDNRFQYNTHKWNHAHTEFTQINWNGILGEMKLVAVDPVYIDDMQLYPDIETNSVDVRLKIDNRTKKPFEGKALLTVSGNGLHVTKEVPVGGEAEEIDLTETEYKILRLLMQSPQRIFPVQVIYEDVWQEPYFYTSNGTVMVHIRNLRMKIEKDPQNPARLQTMWGKGYRFVPGEEKDHA